MKVLLFGASGMVGQGVLRECLLDAHVSEVLAIGRSASGHAPHPKLREVVQADLFDTAALAPVLAEGDACFFCLGVSWAGLSEAAYARLSVDLPLAVARALAALRPGAAFTYVTGAGTDSSGQGRIMWARVKGRAENALLALPLRAVMFRPAAIVPMHGERTKTRSYRILYDLLAPLRPLLLKAPGRWVTTTERVGRAMITIVRYGSPKPVLESEDINRVGA